MYLDWKVKGVSDNFKWIMSISAVHSNCRSFRAPNAACCKSDVAHHRLCMRLKEVLEQELA
jgi:hypothetical protein